ncbi:M20/M25/M40 family metallo-hydrolase [Sphingomonas flavalba]|uniref:M20/M25/M40 family metallo-hydrolase n=1 Tax=Sphingomonas flavalba TaxID=2559804 RepID=UPI0039DFD863
MRRHVLFGVAAALLLASSAHAAPAVRGGDAPVKAIVASPQWKAARDALKAGHDRFVSDIVTITEIPAPPFGEEKRGAAVRAMFDQIGLSDVRVDAVGNVIGLRKGTGADNGLVVIAAHLDTVFPAGTDVKVKREGTVLSAPGIGDDSRGVAALIAIARALDAGKIRTKRDILFIANVGEEGQGDLRGVRHFFGNDPLAKRTSAFFSVDGTDASRIVNGGVGSKRYRAIFRGPGGHSYGAFGLVNPMVAMAKSVAALYEISPPKDPKTTYSASVTGGGTSVNSIPNAVFMEFDMRSESAAELAALDGKFRAIVEQAVADENAARSTRAGTISVELKVIGERPAGQTPDDSSLVRNTQAAIRAVGLSPTLEASSTDSNIPMSIGVPAVTIGSGGIGARAHALDEHIDVAEPLSSQGLIAALTSLVAAAGLAR